jgi:PRC-barrel domain
MRSNQIQRWALSIAVAVCLSPVLALVARGQAIPTAYPADQQNRMASQPATADRMENAAERRASKASEIIGLTVRSANDEEKGKVKDLMIGPDGRVVYAAVSFGGFLGIGDKLFAVPFEALHIVKNGSKNEFARVDVTEQTIKNHQGFDQDHWPDQADQTFVTGAGQRNAERPSSGTPSTR